MFNDKYGLVENRTGRTIATVKNVHEAVGILDQMGMGQHTHAAYLKALYDPEGAEAEIEDLGYHLRPVAARFAELETE